MYTIRNFLAALAAAVLLSTVGTLHLMAQEQKLAPVQYRISFRQAESHRVEIELSIPTEGKSTVELMMPVWTPGSYLVREYARQIEGITAVDGITNAPLSISKSSKNRWEVACPQVSEIVVRYTLYCREMGVRTNWVEKDFAFLTGAATFVTRADALDREHVVRIDSLPHWPKVATSLPTGVDPNGAPQPWTLIASHFDELVDSPIVIGDIDIQSFEAGGAKHYLATVGTDGLWNTKSAAKDVQKIVETEQALWKDVPYKSYWFLNLATESGGGLEHDNSSVLMTSRWAMRQKSKYTDWLGLVSHEFFHTWNVRRLRPKVLMKYDFENEQYTRELWVAEGVTSYYDDLLLARSGLCSPKDYLERLNKGISGVQTSPGRTVQPLVDSSFDAWIKFYRPDENAGNSRISYYTKGALVALLLDVEIRHATSNAKSLDDVMRSLWQEHRAIGYTNEDVIRIANSVSGSDLSPWFHDALETTKELSYDRLLEFYGLEWKTKDPSGAKDAPGETADKWGGTFAGVEVKNQSGLSMVEKVVKGGPAFSAGINVGDELIALDGYRVTAEGWNDRLNSYRPGDRLDCVVSRRGKMVQLELVLGETPRESFTLQRVAKPTEEQEAHWRSWLHYEPSANGKDSNANGK